MADIVFENQIRCITLRVRNTEECFMQLQSIVNDIALKEAEIRDKLDEFSKVLLSFGKNGQSGNITLESALQNLAHNMTLLADAKAMEVKRLKIKVEEELTQYKTVCKNFKDNLKDLSNNTNVKHNLKHASDIKGSVIGKMLIIVI